MPPKKQEEENIAPIIIETVLPIIINCPSAAEALRKAVNIKKNITLTKAVELLKEKGIDKYLSQNKLTEEGQLFVCQNMQFVCQEFTNQIRKPADPKKDQKKDAKKDSKKEEVVEEVEKVIQFDFPKACSEFYFLLDVPKNEDQLVKVLNSGQKIDIILWIEDKVKEGSRKPNYSLLNKESTLQEFVQNLSNTKIAKLNQKSEVDAVKEHEQKVKFINFYRKYRMESKNQDIDQSIILQIPFQRDLEKPENDLHQFLKSISQNICKISLKRTHFEEWKKKQKIIDMVPTIKEIVKKEVQVQEKKQEKKGGKKEAAQVQIEIVEEVIQKKYEDFPANIKSDLVKYSSIQKKRNNEHKGNLYKHILQNLIFAVTEELDPSVKTSVTSIKSIGLKCKNIYDNSPINKVKINNLQQSLRQIYTQSKELSYPLKFEGKSIKSNINLQTILNSRVQNRDSIEFQYFMKYFIEFIRSVQNRLKWNFDDRKYIERLSKDRINSILSRQLLDDPEVFMQILQSDNVKLLILAKINPPGRLVYKNDCFDWKVLPNFQFWNSQFTDHSTSQFYNYSWKNTGNLSIKSKKLLPTDNTIITESIYSIGDSQMKVISLQREDIYFGIKELVIDGHQQNVFWKQGKHFKLQIYPKIQKQKQISNQQKEVTLETGEVKVQIHQKQQEVEKQIIEFSLSQENYSIIFNPTPTIHWKHNSLQESRWFGPKGEIIKYMKSGQKIIYYANGDTTNFQYGKMTRIKKHKQSINGGQQKQLSFITKIEGSKRIRIRQDQTIFIQFQNGDIKIVFADGTQILRKIKERKIQIINSDNIVIRILLPRQKDHNVIGHGSAFAYLGFKNILQRSYDGYLFELWLPEFTYHYFIQKYEYLNKMQTEEVRLLTYKDGSILRVLSNGSITFLSKNDDQSENTLNERWLQLFTTIQEHKEGVYDINLIEGWIQTKDAESNFFRVYVKKPSQANIAVSFNINNDKKETNNFGSGFHVPEENYFLPPPSNSITPRLFLLYEDGTGTHFNKSASQFLNDLLLNSLKNHHVEEIKSNGKIIRQYTKQIKKDTSYLKQTFSESIKPEQFELPNLILAEEKRINNVSSKYNPIAFRTITEVQWNRNFENIDKKVKEIIEKNTIRETELSTLRSQFNSSKNVA